MPRWLIRAARPVSKPMDAVTGPKSDRGRWVDELLPAVPLGTPARRTAGGDGGRRARRAAAGAGAAGLGGDRQGRLTGGDAFDRGARRRGRDRLGPTSVRGPRPRRGLVRRGGDERPG